jgi:hypothetical protein
MDHGPIELYYHDHLRSWGFIWHRPAILVGRHHEDSHDSYFVPDIGLRLLSDHPICSVVDIHAATLTMDILPPNRSLEPTALGADSSAFAACIPLRRGSAFGR